MIQRACGLGALFALFLQGSTGGHMLLVEHTRCAEHGELVHAVRAHHHSTPSLLGATATEALDPRPDTTSDDAHEHCALASNRRNLAVHVANAPVASRSEKAAPAPSFVDELTVVDGKRFRTAPKHSPPA